MANIRVRLPNGQVAQFPEGTPPEQIEAAIANMAQEERPQGPQIPQTLEELRALEGEERAQAMRELGRRAGADAGRGETAVRAGAQGVLFGLGDRLAAAGGALRGAVTPGKDDNFSYSDNLEFMRGVREAASEQNPVTAGVSEVAGAIGGGTALAGAARTGLRAGGALGRSAAQAITPTRGQFGRNLVRAGGEGAAAAGLTEAAEGGSLEDVGQAAALGSAFGVGGDLAMGAGGALGRYAMNRVPGREVPRAISTMARRTGIEPDELMARIERFRAQNDGRGPRLVDILEGNEATRLYPATTGSTRAAETMRDTIIEETRMRPVRVAQEIRGNRPTRGTQTVASEGQGRLDAFRLQNAQAPVRVGAGDRGVIEEILSDYPSALTRSERSAILNEIEEGVVPFNRIDQLRSRISSISKRDGASPAAGEYAEQLRAITERSLPGYRQALLESSEALTEAEAGRAIGREVLAPGTTSEFTSEVVEARTPRASPDLGEMPQARAERYAEARSRGIEEAAENRIIDQTREGEREALQLMRQLTDGGQIDRNTAALGRPRAERLAQIGARETQTAQNLGALAPVNEAIRADSPSAEQLAEAVAEMAAVGTGRASAGFIINAGRVFLPFVNGNAGRATALAQMLVSPEPQDVQRAVRIMRQVGMGDDLIQQFRQGAAIAAAQDSAQGEEQ